jgi:hypothetical protein
VTNSDALLHEVNRRAHEVARAAKQVNVKSRFTHELDGHAMSEVRVSGGSWAVLQRALAAYEEAERRAQAEATA